MQSNVSFGASFIEKVPLKKYSYKKKKYIPSSANFVQLAPENPDDFHTISGVADEFGADSFANNIYAAAKIVRKNSDSDRDKCCFFSLSKQNDKFERLNPDNVLGIAMTSAISDSKTELEYLQVHPQYIYSFDPPYFKRIGSAMLQGLKNLYSHILVKSAPSACPFYIINDFHLVSGKNRVFEWDKN